MIAADDLGLAVWCQTPFVVRQTAIMATGPSSCSEYPRTSFFLTVFGRRLSLFRLLAFAMVAVLVLLGVPGSGAARETRPNSTKVIGLATAVGPAQVTILSGGGREVTVTTREDFTQKVAVGSKVTAWYSVRDGANVLDWMEYPRENFFVPAEQIRTRISKVIILPSSEVPDADGLFDAMSDYLDSTFDWYVAPRVLAEEIRDRALKLRPAATGAGLPRSTLDAINPSTGEFDISRYSQAQEEAGRQSQTQSQPAPDRRKSSPGTASTLDAIDPSTGEFDMARYTQAPAQTPPQAATANRARVPSRAQDPATSEQRLIRTLASKTPAPGPAAQQNRRQPMAGRSLLLITFRTGRRLLLEGR